MMVGNGGKRQRTFGSKSLFQNFESAVIEGNEVNEQDRCSDFRILLHPLSRSPCVCPRLATTLVIHTDELMSGCFSLDRSRSSLCGTVFSSDSDQIMDQSLVSVNVSASTLTLGIMEITAFW